MLGKRPGPMIGKLSELLVSGRRTGTSDLASSPRSPLDLKIQSPRGLKNYDLGGDGLGIVAALEKSSEAGREILLAKSAICSQSLLNRPSKKNPIPVKNSGKNYSRCQEEESLEDYTIVTRHGPDKSFTKVYYGEVEYGYGEIGHHVDDTMKPRTRSNLCDLNRKSAKTAKDHVPDFPTSSFLSSCNLCRKDLHGKDIYMYRGEKAFCSAECRSQQMMIDERKEHCRTEISRSADVSSSAYTGGQIFSTGIAAI